MSLPYEPNPQPSVTDEVCTHGPTNPDGPHLATHWENMFVDIVGTPVVLSRDDRLDVFYQRMDSTDIRVYHKWRIGNTWNPLEEQRVASTRLGFSAVSREEGSYDLFGIGPSSDSLWHVACDSGDWKEKQEIDNPDNIDVAGTPLAVSWGADRLDLFVVMANKRPYHTFKRKTPGNFSSLVHIGGEIIGLPGVTCWGPNRIDISVHGTDNQVYHKSYVDGTWYPTLDSWGLLGGVVTGNLTEVSDRVGRLAVYCIGATASRSVFTKTWGGGEWHPKDGSWINLGGSCADDDISAVSGKEDELHLAIRRSDGTVLHKAWNGAAWEPSQNDWNHLGGKLSSPPVLSPSGSSKLEIFGRWSDGSLRYWSE